MGLSLLSFRPVTEGTPQYLGSDLHISQGLEVSLWSVSPENFNIRLERPGSDQGQIELYLPESPSQVLVNQEEANWQSMGAHVYRIPVKFQKTADIHIT